MQACCSNSPVRFFRMQSHLVTRPGCLAPLTEAAASELATGFQPVPWQIGHSVATTVTRYPAEKQVLKIDYRLQASNIRVNNWVELISVAKSAQSVASVGWRCFI